MCYCCCAAGRTCVFYECVDCQCLSGCLSVNAVCLCYKCCCSVRSCLSVCLSVLSVSVSADSLLSVSAVCQCCLSVFACRRRSVPCVRVWTGSMAGGTEWRVLSLSLTLSTTASRACSHSAWSWRHTSRRTMRAGSRWRSSPTRSTGTRLWGSDWTVTGPDHETVTGQWLGPDHEALVTSVTHLSRVIDIIIERVTVMVLLWLHLTVTAVTSDWRCGVKRCVGWKSLSLSYIHAWCHCCAGDWTTSSLNEIICSPNHCSDVVVLSSCDTVLQAYITKYVIQSLWTVGQFCWWW